MYRWEVSRLREEGRALRRELGEARGAREEMLRIYSRETKSEIYLKLEIYIFYSIRDFDVQLFK